MRPRIPISYSILKITSVLLAIIFTLVLIAPSVSADSSNFFTTDFQHSSPSETDGPLSPYLQVLANDSQNLLLEFKTPEFEIVQSQNNENTCQTINIQEFAEIGEPGWPRLPVYGTLVGIPTESQPSLTVLENNFSPLPGDYNLCAVETNHYERDEFGEILYTGKQAIPDPQVYASQDFIPRQVVEIVSTAYLRSQRVAQIRINPFQYNPSSGELRYIKYLRLQVNFGDQSPKLALPQSSPPDERIFENILEDNLLNYQTAISWRASPNTPASQLSSLSQQNQKSLKILVEQDGIYQLDYEALNNAGVPVQSLDPQQFSLSSQSEAVALHVFGEADGVFDLGDSLLFYGQAANSRYGKQNVYWLTWQNGPGLRMGYIDRAPQSVTPVAEFHRITQHLEQDKLYVSDLPSGEKQDRWYWEYLQASGHAVSHDFTFQLANLSSQPATASLRGLLKGYTASPKHHTEFYINDQKIYESEWLASADFSFEIDFPQAYLQNGDNTLTVKVPLDNGITNDAFYVNWFEMKIKQTFQAQKDQLTFETQLVENQTITINGFSSPEFDVMDITNPRQSIFISAYQVAGGTGNYQISFEQSSGQTTRTIAQNTTQRLSPQIVLDTASNLRSATNAADYILLTHADFLDAAQILANHRTSQGLRVKVVDVQDVYDEFNDGLLDPQAIQDFLTYAYTNWQAPAPSYVVLMGDGNYDFNDNLGYGDTNFIPPYLDDVDPFMGETASDNRYVCVSGNDNLPDMHIGRLPVSSVSEAQALIEKIINYEINPPAGDWNKRVLFIADNADAAGDFAAYSDLAADQILPTSYQAQKVYYTQTHASPQDVRNAIQTNLNEGTLLVNYVGHGIRQYLAAERFITSGEVAELDNGQLTPFWANFGCLTGYFIEPNTRLGDNSSIGEKLTRVPGKGAIASWSATGLGMASGQDYLNRGLYEAIFKAGNMRIGPATTYAKIFLYSGTASYRDLIDTFTLFGDPATQLNIPETDVAVDLKANPGGFVQAGQSISYTLTYENKGGRPAREIIIQEILSTGLENSEIYASQVNTPTQLENQFIWEIPELPAGQSGTITISGRINDDFQGMISNQVTITSASNDYNLDNNTAGPLETLVLSSGSSALYLPFISGN